PSARPLTAPAGGLRDGEPAGGGLAECTELLRAATDRLGVAQTDGRVHRVAARPGRTGSSRPRDDRERAKTLAVQGFSVERVTGIEPAWSAWKASGTSS